MMNSADGQRLRFDDGRTWRLHPKVALRPEPFGALAYHYGNRRLNFLRSPDLVRLVEALPDHPDPHHAFVAIGLDGDRWPSFERALDALAHSDFLQPVAVGAPAEDDRADTAETGPPP